MSTKHLAGLLALACAVTACATEKNQIRVESSRALRLVIVDAERKAVGHDALHTAFAEALAAAFPETLKGQFFLRAVAKANGQEVPDEWHIVVAAK